MDMAIEGLHTETGPGVLEAAIGVDEVLNAADKAVLFKTFTKVIAQRRGLMATFMAKWSKDWPGQSGHIHLSLRNRATGASAFHDASAERGMSTTMRHFIGGQQALMPQVLAMVASTVNSYSRLIPGFWAPTSATWGVENRTTALRAIPGSPSAQRVEFRIAAADANPYIALAAALASGLWGIENAIEPHPAIEGNAYDKPAIPRARTAAHAVGGRAGAEGARRPRERCSATPSSTISPRPASGRNASSASTSPIGNSPAISRSSEHRIVAMTSGSGRREATQRTVSPVDGSIYVERPLATDAQIVAALDAARTAQKAWRSESVEARAALLGRFVDAFVSHRDDIARELTWQMGRPIRYTPGEVRGFEERARHMIAIAPAALADIGVDPKEGFTRFIRREPLGTVLVVAPWNYPLLTAVNAVVPRLWPATRWC